MVRGGRVNLSIGEQRADFAACKVGKVCLPLYRSYDYPQEWKKWLLELLLVVDADDDHAFIVYHLAGSCLAF